MHYYHFCFQFSICTERKGQDETKFFYTKFKKKGGGVHPRCRVMDFCTPPPPPPTLLMHAGDKNLKTLHRCRSHPV